MKLLIELFGVALAFACVAFAVVSLWAFRGTATESQIEIERENLFYRNNSVE